MRGRSDSFKKPNPCQLKTLIIGVILLLIVWFAGAFILDQRQAFLLLVRFKIEMQPF